MTMAEISAASLVMSAGERTWTTYLGGAIRRRARPVRLFGRAAVVRAVWPASARLI